MSPHLRTGRGTETPDPATQATATRLQSAGSSCTTGFQLRLFWSDHALQRRKVPGLSVTQALSPCPHQGGLAGPSQQQQAALGSGSAGREGAQ